ncbi:HTH_Tnp_Tc3_2 domain-containing protein [Trichonephila clavipes]|nr:HTH_Tnp_Tc3_2 domain-containing protein [Trichonephila clavipes]
MSYTRRPGSGRARQNTIDRRLPHHKKCTANCFIRGHPAQVAPSLGAPVSSRNIKRRPPLRLLPSTSTNRRLRLEWCHARGNWTAVEWNPVVFSDDPDSISSVITIMFVCGDPVVNISILPLLYSDTPLPQLV